ncbi:TBC1 domain family member 15 [Heracleum sosnowskyi]|uniref:TBC1 domain family member 15 n=1 Tax=Heracleum sosnowskyi TaxID=360622 RepID=A0AAD8IXM8_9APIA|nr:TBC1 domain family member 15 [Heracleum sosnowskyi]
MRETEFYDLSDDADYAAASVYQGSSSVSSSDNSKRNDSSSEIDGGGSQLVYLKDNVAIHPTQYASERITGRLRLIKQGTSLFMTWIPYQGQSSNARVSENDRNLYTIRAVPFTEIRSVRRHTPTLGWQYVIVVLSSGLAFPPLYFYNGGVRDFFATIKKHVHLVRSAEDTNVFLVNDFQDPLQRTLSSLEIPLAVVNGPSQSFSTTVSLSTTNKGKVDETFSSNQQNGRQRQKNHDPARDLSIQVLEKFSLVTRFARETTNQIFGENSDVFGSSEKRNRNQPMHVHPHNVAANDAMVPIESPVMPDPLEKVQCRKQNHDEEAVTTVGNFELVDSKEVNKSTLVWGKPRQPPLGPEEWTTFLDTEGRVVDAKALRKRIFYGGVEHSLRKEVWAFLLGYYADDCTYAEREYLVSVKKSEYETLKNQWKSISAEQAKRFTKFRERKGLIEKDVVRTDRSLSFYEGDDNPNVILLHDILLTYSFFNFDLGYCQGMSDLLSPILFVMKNESEAFWCFVSLMERLGPNFNRDQNGMHSQLFALSKLVELLDSPLHAYLEQRDCLNYFFCFRWILIQFKREFEYERTMRLWEVLWTHYLSEHMHLYVCVAILKKYRKKIMGEQMDFDTLLKFINELSEQIDLDAILRDAEALCICAGESGSASIPPGTPPSLPIEDGSLLYQQDDDSVL